MTIVINPKEKQRAITSRKCALQIMTCKVIKRKATVLELSLQDIIFFNNKGNPQQLPFGCTQDKLCSYAIAHIPHKKDMRFKENKSCIWDSLGWFHGWCSRSLFQYNNSKGCARESPLHKPDANSSYIFFFFLISSIKDEKATVSLTHC